LMLEMEGAPLLWANQHTDENVENLSILQFQALTKWLRLCGIVVWTGADNLPGRSLNTFSRFVVPGIIPAILFASSFWGDYFCYGKISGCTANNDNLFNNVAYNARTIYIWIGMILGIFSLHISMFLFARSGKLEALFRKLKATPDTDRRIRFAFRVWAVCCSIVVVGAITASIAYVIYKISNGCTQQFVICLLPQSIQIVSGVSILFTGVSLIHIVCILLGQLVKQEKERQLQLLATSQLQTYVTELENLKLAIKQTCEDIQKGNAIALFGGFITIFASLWTFVESYYEYSQTLIGIPPGFSLSIWTLIGSLLLTFFVLFSFANITKACDQLLDIEKREMAKYVVKQDKPTVSLAEFFVILSVWQQRFGFHIFGVLMIPEVVRALASAAVTVAATIIKLVIPTF